MKRQRDMIYDVAIIGAGPAGASLAYFLSDSDRRIVLIERKEIADTPVRCAELMPKAITQLYDGEVAGINNEINYMETYITGKLANIIKSPGFIMDRNVFTGFLIKEFVKNGGIYLNSANFLNAKYLNCPNQGGNNMMSQSFEGCRDEIGFMENKVLSLLVRRRNNDKPERIKTRILVGSDGSYSRVRKIMNSFFGSGDKTHDVPCGNTQKEVLSDGSHVVAFQENLVKQKHYEDNAKIFFYPNLICGYGWLFPKKDNLNIGIAMSMEAARNKGLKDVYFWFKDELLKKNFISGFEKQNSSVAGLAPVSGIKCQIAKNNIVLIGDAAGLCNPITGAGNFNAAASAKIVSEYIKKALKTGDSGILKGADMEIKNFFGSSLSHARSKRNILEEKWATDDFESLIGKTWISFKDYWQRTKI